MITFLHVETVNCHVNKLHIVSSLAAFQTCNKTVECSTSYTVSHTSCDHHNAISWQKWCQILFVLIQQCETWNYHMSTNYPCNMQVVSIVHSRKKDNTPECVKQDEAKSSGCWRKEEQIRPILKPHCCRTWNDKRLIAHTCKHDWMYWQFWVATCDLCIVIYDSAVTEYSVIKIITVILQCK